MPYAMPRNQNPAKMGMVCGKAALKAFRFIGEGTFQGKLRA